MNVILSDNVWQRKGISVLWNDSVLTQINRDSKVISLRQFITLYEEKWPIDTMPLINSRQLLVAGLDAAIDSLSAEEAEEWIRDEIYSKIYDFQNFFEGQLALTFWMTDQNRWKEYTSENRYTWLSSSKYNSKEIELGTAIWNGAQKSVRQIVYESKWIGLFLDRIS